MAEQNRNTSQNRLIEFRGEVRCLADWCSQFGLPGTTLSYRLDHLNWSVERAFTTPGPIKQPPKMWWYTDARQWCFTVARRRKIMLGKDREAAAEKLAAWVRENCSGPEYAKWWASTKSAV